MSNQVDRLRELFARRVVEIAKISDPAEQVAAVTELYIYSHFVNTFGAAIIMDLMQATGVGPGATTMLLERLKKISSAQWSMWIKEAKDELDMETEREKPVLH